MKTIVVRKIIVAAVVLVAAATPIHAGPLGTADDKSPAKPEQGRLTGRFTTAGTGQPVASAKVQVLILGMPDTNKSYVEAISDADGNYALDVPFGECRVWGVFAPAGYYSQDEAARGGIVTSTEKPRVVRDFVLQAGAPWRLEVHGVPLPLEKSPHFSAWPNSDSHILKAGDVIGAQGNIDGKAVLSTPTTGSSYQFNCAILASRPSHEVPPLILDIDKDFDPRQITEVPAKLADGKVVLRDAAGRKALVEGGEVVVEGRGVILRFHAKPIARESALVFRGKVTDEAGKPIEGAKCTAAFKNSRGGSVWQHVEATTDAEGKFEIQDVLLQPSDFTPDRKATMIIVKPGYDGVETKALNLPEVQKAGSGDFGTAVLKPGRTFRGKVIDENGRPLHGAVVTNNTNYFLYGHLQCRTDAEGRFVMPDLSFGKQWISGQYGERYAKQEFQFEDESTEQVITARLIPKPGRRKEETPKPKSVPAASPAKNDNAWDLTPPANEPKYNNEPRYALLVFGPTRDQRVWMVLDGATLYVDRNANGDLRDADERLEPNNPTDGSNRFGNPGSHTHFDLFEFTVQAGAGGTSKFKFQHWVRAENFTPKTDFDKKIHERWLKLRGENGTLYRLDGLGQGQTPMMFMPKPADAQVCALDGPLTFAVRTPEAQVLNRGEAGCDVAFEIIVKGRPPRGVDYELDNRLNIEEVPKSAYLKLEIDYPGKTVGAPPLRRMYELKERC